MSDSEHRRRSVNLLACAALLLLASACATQPPPAPPATASTGLSETVLSAALERADAALENGVLEDAATHYQLVLSRDPENRRARMGMAELHLMTGSTKLAEEEFAALATAPDLPATVLQGLGLARLMNGKPKSAEDALTQAVARDPGLWRAWNGLGQIHDTRGEWGQAEASYNRAIGLHPDAAILHNNLGFSLLLQGRYEDAAGRFAEALALDRNLMLARNNLRLALAWQGRYADSMRAAQTDELPEVLNNVGYIAMLRGDYEPAEAYLTRAMETSPSYFRTASRNLTHLQSVKMQGTSPAALPVRP